VLGSGWETSAGGHLGKLLLLAPGKDRAATLGFRCAMDAK
jgi:hypothetical protein